MATSDANQIRILVVDDNPLIRDSFTAAVQRLNGRLTGQTILLLEAGDGAAAWRQFEGQAIDLLVVDLYIPVLDGLSIIARVREHPTLATTKILAMSASIEDARVRSLGAGADRFLQKPIRLVDIVDALVSLLKLELT